MQPVIGVARWFQARPVRCGCLGVCSACSRPASWSLLAAGPTARMRAPTAPTNPTRPSALRPEPTRGRARRRRRSPRSRRRRTSSSSRSPSSASRSTAPTASMTQSAVSTGQSGFPTPTGVFSVIQKNRYHRSNIYSGAPMPFMQRITWSGVALHAGVLPGYPASHGCIRLTHQLRRRAVGHDPDGRARGRGAGRRAARRVRARRPAGADHDAGAGDGRRCRAGQARRWWRWRSDKTADSRRRAPTPAAKLLNPLERAKAAQGADRRRGAGQGQGGQGSGRGVGGQSRARPTRRSPRCARPSWRLPPPAPSVDAATKAVEAAKTPEAPSGPRRPQSRGRGQARGSLARPRPRQPPPRPPRRRRRSPPRTAAWDAEKASDAAAAVVRAGERATEPISVFVSKKTGRVYIRQAWAPIHEAPVTFKDAGAAARHPRLRGHGDGGGRQGHALALGDPAAAGGEPRRRRSAGATATAAGARPSRRPRRPPARDRRRRARPRRACPRRPGSSSPTGCGPAPR